jgi:hypothetical protein
MVAGILGLGIVALLDTGCTSDASPDAVVRESVVANDARFKAEEPERVVRQFMIAMAKGDREGMLSLMRPNPDVDLLLRMRKPEDEAELVELFRTLPITRLGLGDQLADPFSPGQRIVPAMIDADHLVLNMRTKGKDAWTFFLVREGGKWRLNMDWFIELLKHPGAAPRISS